MWRFLVLFEWTIHLLWYQSQSYDVELLNRLFTPSHVQCWSCLGGWLAPLHDFGIELKSISLYERSNSSRVKRFFQTLFGKKLHYLYIVNNTFFMYIVNIKLPSTFLYTYFFIYKTYLVKIFCQIRTPPYNNQNKNKIRGGNGS